MEPNMVSGRGFRNEAPAFCAFGYQKGKVKQISCSNGHEWGGEQAGQACFPA